LRIVLYFTTESVQYVLENSEFPQQCGL